MVIKISAILIKKIGYILRMPTPRYPPQALFINQLEKETWGDHAEGGEINFSIETDLLD
jgi:hypothetical protein